MPTIYEFFKKLQNSKALKVLMIVAPICGSIATIYNFSKIWDGLGLPRPVFYNEFYTQKYQIKQQILELEIDFRTRAIKSDLRTIRDINKEIQLLIEQKIEVPDSLIEFKTNLEDNIQENREKLKALNKFDVP